MKYLYYKFIGLFYKEPVETKVEVVKVMTLLPEQMAKLEAQLPNSLITSQADSAEFKLGVQHALNVLRKGFVA